MSQGRVGDPHRGGRDGARTVADGCVDTPAMLIQSRAAKPSLARVVGPFHRRTKGRNAGPTLRRWLSALSSKEKGLWLSVREWQHAGHRLNV